MVRDVFPFAFLLIALPVPSVIQTGITTTLQHYVAAVTVEILAIWGIPAQLGGNIIFLSTGLSALMKPAAAFVAFKAP